MCQECRQSKMVERAACGQTGFRTKDCVRILWSEKSKHVREHSNKSKQKQKQKQKQNKNSHWPRKTVVDKIPTTKGLYVKMGLNVLEVTYATYCYVSNFTAHSPTAPTMVR